MARAGAATVSAAAKQVSSRSSSVANPHAQTEPSNLRRSMPPGAAASAIKRRCFPDLLRNPRNHRHSALPSKQLEFAPNECVDRNYITAGLKPKQVLIVGVGWPCEGRCRFANPEAPTDDQAAANLAQTARPTFMTAAMSEMGQSRPRLPALALPDVRYASISNQSFAAPRLVATGQQRPLPPRLI